MHQTHPNNLYLFMCSSTAYTTNSIHLRSKTNKLDLSLDIHQEQKYGFIGMNGCEPWAGDGVSGSDPFGCGPGQSVTMGVNQGVLD